MISWVCASDLDLVTLHGSNSQKSTISLAELRFQALSQSGVPDLELQGHVVTPMMIEKDGSFECDQLTSMCISKIL